MGGRGSKDASSYASSIDGEKSPRNGPPVGTKGSKGSRKRVTEPGPVRNMKAQMYKELAIKAASRVQFPHLDPEKTTPEITQLRRQVMGMAGQVDTLGQESDTMQKRISDMKKNLRDADFGLGILRRAQEESIKKIIMQSASVTSKRVQVNPDDPYFVKVDTGAQTRSIEEMLIMYAATRFKKSAGVGGGDSGDNKLKKNASINDLGLTLEQIESVLSVFTGDPDREEEQEKKPPGEIRPINELAPDEDEELKQRKRELNWVKKAKLRRSFCKKLKKRQKENGNHMKTSAILVLSSLVLLGCLGYHFYLILQMMETAKDLRARATAVMERPRVITCPLLNAPALGKFTCKGEKHTNGRHKSGTVCSFSCIDWHRPSSKSYDTRCTEAGEWSMETPKCIDTPCETVKDRDCANMFRHDLIPRQDGIRTIVQCRTFQKLEVFCDATTAGGGWTVIQMRQKGDVEFKRNRTSYEQYFGYAMGDYWLGLEAIHLLMRLEKQSLMVILEDWYFPNYHNQSGIAFYKHFNIEGREAGYRLRVSDFDLSRVGSPLDAGDSLAYSDGMQFSTFDSDRDWNPTVNCAKRTGSGWWHRNCTEANLNGIYAGGQSYGETAVYWKSWRVESSLKRVRMMIRPVDWT